MSDLSMKRVSRLALSLALASSLLPAQSRAADQNTYPQRAVNVMLESGWSDLSSFRFFLDRISNDYQLEALPILKGKAQVWDAMKAVLEINNPHQLKIFQLFVNNGMHIGKETFAWQELKRPVQAEAARLLIENKSVLGVSWRGLSVFENDHQLEALKVWLETDMDLRPFFSSFARINNPEQVALLRKMVDGKVNLSKNFDFVLNLETPSSAGVCQRWIAKLLGQP